MRHGEFWTKIGFRPCWRRAPKSDAPWAPSGAIGKCLSLCLLVADTHSSLSSLGSMSQQSQKQLAESNPVVLAVRMLEQDIDLKEIVRMLSSHPSVDARLALCLLMQQQAVPILQFDNISLFSGFLMQAVFIAGASITNADRAFRPFTYQADLSLSGVIDAKCAACIEALLDTCSAHASANPDMWMSAVRRHCARAPSFCPSAHVRVHVRLGHV